MVFKNPPTALDGVIFAVIRRIVSEHDFKIIFVSKLGQALHKLGPQWLLFADEGQLKKSQLQEQANQDSALTLVTNAIIVWNTVYMQAVIDQLKQEGYVINESDLQHISPCRFEHLNKHGKLAFNVVWVSP